MKNNFDNKSRNSLTFIILVVAGFLILFSFTAPYLLTKSAFAPHLDFSKTGQIGDTVGGITSPFIGVAGVLLTFLAFYMQIQANRIQVEQFNTKIQIDEANREKQEKTNYLNKLRLLVVDLEVILSDVSNKIEHIEDYIKRQKELPLQMVTFVKTPNKSYTRVLEIDRESIFNGFRVFLCENDTWIKDFSNLYSILEFLPEFLDKIYTSYDRHSKDIYNHKMMIREELNNFIVFLGGIINTYYNEEGKKEYLNFPISCLADSTIKQLDQIIESDRPNPVEETDFSGVLFVLTDFITKILKIRKEQAYHDLVIDESISLARSMRIKINYIGRKNESFLEYQEQSINSLMKESSEEKSYYHELKDLKDFIKEEIAKVDLN